MRYLLCFNWDRPLGRVHQDLLTLRGPLFQAMDSQQREVGASRFGGSVCAFPLACRHRNSQGLKSGFAKRIFST